MPTKIPTILLVDDDSSKRLFLKLFLEKTFGSVVICESDSGQAAIKYLLGHEVVVVITDYKMEPVDGLELARWIRLRSPQLPIMMVTGHPEIHSEALKAGANYVGDTSELTALETALRATQPWIPFRSEGDRGFLSPSL
jgi:CheY-like chemotaxis protein